MNKQPHILIVDDDKEIAQLISDYLEQHHFRTSIAHHFDEMRRLTRQYVFDLVVLDVMLPGKDGISICKQWREDSSIPIIMLSAAGSESDRVVGLEVGADDYLTKPFSQRELLARIKSLLRRAEGRTILTATENQQIQFGPWRLDTLQRTLIDQDDLHVALSQAEYLLLHVFLEHPNRPLSRDQLMDLTQGREIDVFERSIDVLIGRLRKKIEPNPKEPSYIKTVRNVGYQFCLDNQDD